MTTITSNSTRGWVESFPSHHCLKWLWYILHTIVVVIVFLVKLSKWLRDNNHENIKTKDQEQNSSRRAIRQQHSSWTIGWASGYRKRRTQDSNRIEWIKQLERPLTAGINNSFVFLQFRPSLWMCSTIKFSQNSIISKYEINMWEITKCWAWA